MTGEPRDGFVRLDAADLTATVTGIFAGAGIPDGDADVVARDLVLADQLGVHTHGVARVGEYLAAIDAGRIVPGGQCAVVRQKAATALVDGGGNFGQVSARFALSVAAERARQAGAAVVVTRNSHHVGRVGAIGEIAAASGLIALAFVAVGIPGPVAPLAGAQGRLGTNPIAYGVPTSEGPVVADFATAAWPESAVQLALAEGRQVPPGVLVDGAGEPTTEPAALYADPPGAILPFGGAWAHRGYALNLLTELLGGALGGYGPQDPTRPSNCLFLLVVDPSAFGTATGPGFTELAGATVAFVRSARPADGRRVQVPGEPEQANRAAIGDRVDIDRDVRARLEALRGVA